MKNKSRPYYQVLYREFPPKSAFGIRLHVVRIKTAKLEALCKRCRYVTMGGQGGYSTFLRNYNRLGPANYGLEEEE